MWTRSAFWRKTMRFLLAVKMCFMLACTNSNNYFCPSLGKHIIMHKEGRYFKYLVYTISLTKTLLVVRLTIWNTNKRIHTNAFKQYKRWKMWILSYLSGNNCNNITFMYRTDLAKANDVTYNNVLINEKC